MNVLTVELLRKSAFGLCVAAGSLATASSLSAQNAAGEFVDPQTGNVYRSVTQQVTRPVVDERIERQERTVYVPETVKETRPEVRTTYLPITQMKWRPYVKDRWNPFRQPRVCYRQVPETHWEARSEVINRTTMQTRWIAEKRTVEIPHRTVRYETTRKTDLQLVARRMPPPQVGSNIDPQVAARLRPLSPSESAQFASTPIGKSSNNPPLRSSMQAGMKTNVLQPAPTLGTPLPPATAGEVIATVPSYPIYR